ILEKINGVFTFDQISPQSSAVFGIIFKGIDENSPEDYFIRIDNVTTVSFEKLAITIDPPKAGPWNVTLTGNVTKLVGLKFAVLKNDTVLDSTIIERYA
ncbi:8798_t:CDS:1, partial [Gigaspora rosea]